MHVELVRVTTADGAVLDGALNRPEPNASNPLNLDAMALIHGTGGNFYSSTFFELLATRLAARGIAALRANTRGHDGISTLVTTKGAQRLGAAYEVVDDCRHDLTAWMGWLAQNVGPRVGLLGHSLGAVKAIYTLAHGQTPALVRGLHESRVEPAALVAISPPRLSYSWFCQGAHAAEFLAAYRQAEELAASGQPQALMEVKLPLPFVITAAGYLEKYGPAERYNYLNFLAGVRCPALVLFGGAEIQDNMAFQQGPEEVGRVAQKKPHLAVDIVAGADHFYTGLREQAWQKIEAWLTSTQGTRP